jgi:hypothetical protein
MTKNLTINQLEDIAKEISKYFEDYPDLFFSTVHTIQSENCVKISTFFRNKKVKTSMSVETAILTYQINNVDSFIVIKIKSTLTTDTSNISSALIFTIDIKTEIDVELRKIKKYIDHAYSLYKLQLFC